MRTIPEKVKEIINKSPVYRELLAEDLINVSALARKIRPEIEKSLIKDVTEASVVMALKRLSIDLRYISKTPIKYANHIGDISVKSNLFEVTYKNSKSLQDSLNHLMVEILNEDNQAYITYIKGVAEITIISEERFKPQVLQAFKKEEIETNFNNLSGITVGLTNEHITAPGVIAYILMRIAWKDISLIEVVSTFSELTLIIEDENVNEVFGIVREIKRGI